jgi:hypothetical protein
MAIIPQIGTSLRIRLPADISPRTFLKDIRQSIKLHRDGVPVRTLHIIENGYKWHVVPGVAGPAHPWDAAHALSQAAAAKGYAHLYVEPDLVQTFPFGPFPTGDGQVLTFDGNWPPSSHDNAPLDWHLYKSTLKNARDVIGNPPSPCVRVAHLDTGYSEIHETRPRNLQRQLAVNLVEGGAVAVDPAEQQPLSNLLFPGHGTFTIALLAGGHCYLTNDDLGGAPFAEIVPIRVSNSVLQFASSAIADGISRAMERNCHVITLSMGGSGLDLGSGGQLSVQGGLRNLRRCGEQYWRVSHTRHRLACSLSTGYWSIRCYI